MLEALGAGGTVPVFHRGSSVYLLPRLVKRQLVFRQEHDVEHYRGAAPGITVEYSRASWAAGYRAWHRASEGRRSIWAGYRAAQ